VVLIFYKEKMKILLKRMMMNKLHKIVVLIS
jgi:hypothetical protein